MAVDASLVGSASRTGSGAQDTSTGSVTSGDTLVILVSTGVGSAAGTVSDTAGNSYTLIGTNQNDGLGGTIRMWRSENVTGHATMKASITSMEDGTIYLVKVTGAATASFDVNTQGQDFTSPFTLASGTLGQADEVIVTICAANDAVGGSYASSNTTILGQQDDAATYWSSAVSKQVVASTTSFSPSFTKTGGSASAVLKLASFKQATGGGPSQPLRIVGPTFGYAGIGGYAG